MDFFQSEDIQTFIRDSFLLMNIFGHSFGMSDSNKYIQIKPLNKIIVVFFFFLNGQLDNSSIYVNIITPILIPYLNFTIHLYLVTI